MKKRSSLLLGMLALGSAVSAQFMPVMFNTGSLPPVYANHQTYGLKDVAWTVAQTADGSTNTPPITGYVKAVVVNASGTGWFNPNPAPYPLASWVTYPNTCIAGNPANHGCVNYAPPANWGVDQWYKLQFYICGDCQFCITMDMWADNRIQDVWVNENSIGGPGYYPNNGSGIGDPGNYQGYATGADTLATFCSNFQPGMNTIIVHVKSHGLKRTDLAGLLVNCTAVTPCDGVMYFPPVEDEPIETPTISLTGGGGGGVSNGDDSIYIDHGRFMPDRDGGIKFNSSSTQELSVISLDQNIPNPFTESTSISYDIPAGTVKAQMVFVNNEGHVVRRVDLKAGHGSITVFANDLNKGIYSYSIVVDGKTMASKKLIKE